MKNSNPLPLDKLVNLLFIYVRKSNGREYINKDVASGSGVSKASLTLIRQGKQQNPTLNTIRALLAFFDVPSNYLDASSKEEAIQIIESKHKNVSRLKFRTQDSELSPRAMQQIRDIVQYALEVQHAQEHNLPEPELLDFNSKEDDDLT